MSYRVKAESSFLQFLNTQNNNQTSSFVTHEIFSQQTYKNPNIKSIKALRHICMLMVVIKTLLMLYIINRSLPNPWHRSIGIQLGSE